MVIINWSSPQLDLDGRCWSNLVVDVSPGEFGLTLDGFVGFPDAEPSVWPDGDWIRAARFLNNSAVFGFRSFNLLWNWRCCSTNGIMGDAAQQSCPTLMDIYCFFWSVGDGHTHALILMSPPASSCCSPLSFFPLFSYFWVYLPCFSSCQCPEVVEGKSDADTQRQSGDSEAASRLNNKISSETWRLLTRRSGEAQLRPESIWTWSWKSYLLVFHL